MLNKNINNFTTIVLALLMCAAFVRSLGQNGIAQLYYQQLSVITVENVCEAEEMADVPYFLDKNVFLYLKKHTRSGVIINHQKYKNALNEHKR